MTTENKETTMQPEPVSFRFGGGAMRRFVAGTKRAAVVTAGQAVLLGVGSSLVARSRVGDARLPLQVRAHHDLPGGLGGLPEVAAAAGLTLADFTIESEWAGYIESVRESVSGSAVLLVVEPTGPLTGTLYDKKNKKPVGPGALAWYRVDLDLLAPPAAPIYWDDQKTLAERITTVLDHLAPAAETREAADAVVEVLLQTGRAHGKVTPELAADLGHTRVNATVEWLRRNKLLVGLARERVWSPRLLIGLRVRIPVSQAGDRTPEPDHRPPPAARR